MMPPSIVDAAPVPDEPCAAPAAGGRTWSGGLHGFDVMRVAGQRYGRAVGLDRHHGAVQRPQHSYEAARDAGPPGAPAVSRNVTRRPISCSSASSFTLRL